MTGPDHYREAENLLWGKYDSYGGKRPPTEAEVAKAHVHALLAQVALASIDINPMHPQAEAWSTAIKDRCGEPCLSGHTYRTGQCAQAY